MTAAEILDRLRELPPPERRQLLNLIWDEFADADLGGSPDRATKLDRSASKGLPDGE